MFQEFIKVVDISKNNFGIKLVAYLPQLYAHPEDIIDEVAQNCFDFDKDLSYGFYESQRTFTILDASYQMIFMESLRSCSYFEFDLIFENMKLITDFLVAPSDLVRDLAFAS